MAEPQAKSSIGDSLVAHILTLVLGAGGSYVAFKGQALEAGTRQTQILYERIADLELQAEKRGEALQAERLENGTLTATVALLRVQNTAGYAASPRSAVFGYLEAIGLPAWIKEWEPESKTFRMMYINRHYENEYPVTRAKYIGSTDYDIFSKEHASEFYQNDLVTLDSRSPHRVVETVQKRNGKVVDEEFVKAYFRFPDGTEAVTGLQISDNAKMSSVKRGLIGS